MNFKLARFALLTVVNVYADDVILYEHNSRHIYDRAEIVKPMEFDDRRLTARLRDFAISQRGKHVLARLTVGPRRSDVQSALNNDLPGLRVHLPVLKTGLVPAPNVAQVLVFNGNATAYIRRNNYFKQYQLFGEQSARKWDVQSLSLTVVGFRLRTDPRGPNTAHDQLPDRVWIYAVAREIPDLTNVSAMYDLIGKQLGTITFLILRTDPFFFDFDGPLCDPFEVPGSKLSEHDFLTKPFIVCQPTAERCKVRTTH